MDSSAAAGERAQSGLIAEFLRLAPPEEERLLQSILAACRGDSRRWTGTRYPQLDERHGELPRRLADRILAAANAESEDQRAELVNVCIRALRGLTPTRDSAITVAGIQGWQTVLLILDALRPSGYVSLGRLLPDGALDKLITETQVQCEQARPVDDALKLAHIAELGPLGRRVAANRELRALVGSGVGAEVEPVAAGVLWYPAAGYHLAPHVDRDEFTINVLLMVQHSYPHQASRSALVVYPPNGLPERVEIRPGHAIVLRGAGTVHAREPLGQDEQLAVMTIGFETV